MNPDAKCEDCRYWQRRRSSDGKTTEREGVRRYESFAGLVFGQCRFNPPTKTEGQIGDLNQFPLTNPNDWCGKFESKTWRQESTGPK